MEVNKYGDTPLSLSLDNNLQLLANFLMENIKPGDLNNNQLSTAAYQAAAGGGPGDDAATLAMITKLVEAAGDGKAEMMTFRYTGNGESFLHRAAGNGKIQTVEY